jgi:hypothetical protein
MADGWSVAFDILKVIGSSTTNELVVKRQKRIRLPAMVDRSGWKIAVFKAPIPSLISRDLASRSPIAAPACWAYL